jgi:hypothetical protein
MGYDATKVTILTANVNWFGFAAGIIALIVLVVSLFIPWWQLTVGDNLMNVNASPVNTNFGLFGTQFTLPLISALNIVSILTFASSGLVMLFYSVKPTKSYSQQLLGFSYKKPLFSLIAFVSGLLIITSIASLFGIEVPILGSTTVKVTSGFLMWASVETSITGAFQFPFWLGVVAAVMSIAARLYHGRIMVKESNKKPLQLN